MSRERSAAAMSRFFCCFTGGRAPYGDDHLRNYAFRYKLDLPDDRNTPELSLDQAMSSPQVLLLPVFTFEWKEIEEATEQFNRLLVLGEGAFGKVYRCNFGPNNVGAAKIQSLDAPYGHDEFAAEIKALHRARHPNVIKLLGKAFGRDRRALVYEFMPNASLDYHLFAGSRRGPALEQTAPDMNWYARTRIALGVARALRYLHSTLKVLHLDRPGPEDKPVKPPLRALNLEAFFS